MKVGGKRAYALARAGEEVELAEREVVVSRFELLWRDGERAGVRDRVRLRGPTCGRSSPTSATPTASSCAARGSGRSTSPTPAASCRSTTRSASCPRSSSAEDEARRAAHGVAVAGEAPAPVAGGAARGVVRLLDADGLVALAEPRGDGTLKPVVGFRG